MKTYRFCKKTYRARILIENARFAPFGLDIVEISFEASKCLGGNRVAKSILGCAFDYPPRPCASRRVEAPTKQQPSKPPKPPNQAPRGRVYPPPTDAPAHSGINFLGGTVAFLKSKILRKNDCILFLDPFGANNDTIKPSTMHIIHAIRRLYAQSAFLQDPGIQHPP